MLQRQVSTRSVGRPLAPLTVALCALGLGACGPAAAEAPGAKPSVAPTGSALRQVSFVTPSRLLPEVDAEGVEPAGDEHGGDRLMVVGLRILVGDDGTIERADERFPSGAVSYVSLPVRLGGGFLFYQADSQGTRLWRAPSWVGKLVPLSQLGATAGEIVVGFDRLYLRTESTNRLLAVDPEDGRIVPLGQLPAAGAYGAMSFADGWRAVVDMELRGPMASFDAGASWHPIPIPGRVDGAAVEDGNSVLLVGGARYRIDAWGGVQLVAEPLRDSRATDAPEQPAAHGASLPTEPGIASRPLGRHPVRAAVQSGWPDSPSSAIVAEGGALVRVSLPDGRILAVAPKAYREEDAQCQGVRAGAGFGFVCGQQRGATVVYAFAPPLALRELARFSGPRFVSPSGNGALVVRGSCAAGPASASPEIRSYCIVSSQGGQREIGVRGDVGSERVVALGDGRVVVLVPPRIGAAGRLTVIAGDALSSVELKIPDEPKASSRLARRGLWLEGFAERGPDRIGGWVEAGGPVIGVTVKLDGTVELGKAVERGNEVLVSGPFGLAVAETEGGLESTDGGMSWKAFELPRLPDSPRDAPTRGCSPVGCALRNWVRVGWGKPRVPGDLGLAVAPEPATLPTPVLRSVRLRCALAGRIAARAGAAPERPGSGGQGTGDEARVTGNWSAFLGRPPPRLGKDEEGVAKGTGSYDEVPAHAYVWGPKGADWARAGYWLVRFDDRFDRAGGLRESAPTHPPWSDRSAAADAIGLQAQGGYWRWVARLDPSGHSALLSSCLGPTCRLYGVSEGRPILPFRDAAGRTSGLPVPLAQGTVRVGESWYFTTEAGQDAFELWRAELGVVERLTSYPRLGRRGYVGAGPPTLVRRALGRELGLLLSVPTDPSSGSSVGSWIVLPIDGGTGKLGEPVTLGPADLGGQMLPTCGEAEDGWLVETELESAVAVELVGAANYIDGVEMRLRLEPGGGCVEAVAARVARPFDDGARPKGGHATGAAHAAAEPTIPLVAREQGSPVRWLLECEAPR